MFCSQINVSVALIQFERPLQSLAFDILVTENYQFEFPEKLLTG